MAASLGGLLTHLMRAGKENCNMAVSKVLGKETFFYLFVCILLCFVYVFQPFLPRRTIVISSLLSWTTYNILP